MSCAELSAENRSLWVHQEDRDGTAVRPSLPLATPHRLLWEHVWLEHAMGEGVWARGAA